MYSEDYRDTLLVLACLLIAGVVSAQAVLQTGKYPVSSRRRAVPAAARRGLTGRTIAEGMPMTRALLNSALAGMGTTIFAEMSALAVETGSVNLGQGFPDTDGPIEVARTAAEAVLGRAGQPVPAWSGHPGVA